MNGDGWDRWFRRISVLSVLVVFLFVGATQPVAREYFFAGCIVMIVGVPPALVLESFLRRRNGDGH